MFIGKGDNEAGLDLQLVECPIRLHEKNSRLRKNQPCAHSNLRPLQPSCALVKTHSTRRPTLLSQLRFPARNSGRLVALLVSASLLAGCLSAPSVELDPPLPAQWRNTNADPNSHAVTDPAWWKTFQDSRLDALVESALRGNLDVAQAVERLHAARLLDHHASDPYLPNLRARTDDAIDPDASASYFIVGFDSLWEFGLFGQRASAQRVSKAQLDAAKIGVEAARVSLVAEIARNWIELRSAQHQESTLLRIRDSLAERSRLSRIRQSNALSSTAEINAIESELADADAQLSVPRQTINGSLQRLAVLAGRNSPDDAWRTVGAQPTLGSIRVSTVPADLLRSRPEIAYAEADVLRAAGELGISRAQMYPYIGLRAGIQWSTRITSDHPSPSKAIMSLGPTIDIPLFDWGTRVANAHAHSHLLQAALLAYRQSVLTGVGEVEIALGDLEQARLRQDALARAAAAALAVAEQAATRVKLGLDSPLDGDDQRAASERKSLELLQARAQHGLAFVALQKALGGGGVAEVDPDVR